MPVDVFGNSQNSTFFGTLNPASVSLQKEINSFSVTFLSLTVSIKAHGTSPHFSSGLATTAAIDTDGCFARVFSISIEEIFFPLMSRVRRAAGQSDRFAFCNSVC